MITLKMNAWYVFLSAFTLVASGQFASGAGWGTLKGKFVVDGTVAAAPPVDASKDAFCVSVHPVNETVVIGEGNALVNAVVYLRGKKIEVNDEYKSSAAEPVTLDNKGCDFHPHIALVRTGQPFVIKNSDPTGHNTNLGMKNNPTFNQIIPAGEKVELKFTKAEALPLPVNCNIHPFMSGCILVLDHPYMAASGEDGSFEIKNIPAGKQEFQLWHEKPGNLKDLKFTGGKTNKQGRAELTIADGQTLDLGEIKVPASMLQ